MRIEPLTVNAYVGSHRFKTLGRDVAGMVGVEHKLDASAFVLAVRFRIPTIVADQRAAPNALYVKNANVASWTIVGQVASLPISVSSAKHLVVAIDELTAIVDNVQAIVRLMPSGQSVG